MPYKLLRVNEKLLILDFCQILIFSTPSPSKGKILTKNGPKKIGDGSGSRARYLLLSRGVLEFYFSLIGLVT